ncbi:MAG TPA: septal ring lytic transglycosylase RlpA family protein [Puia sp.]|nr:septal ring lytic transglycosylase RlpA family protein [Puia sp.]
MNKPAAILTVCLLTSSFSIAQHKNSSSGSAHQKKSSKIHYGTASFYADKFEGRKTANGEIFSQKKMTGASNIISLNTWVRVTNLHNKKEAVVKITDRMHKNNKRLIDLSHIAAKKLGYTGNGLAKVKVEVLGKKAPPGWVAIPNKE